jgi:hypothetical protein
MDIVTITITDRRPTTVQPARCGDRTTTVGAAVVLDGDLGPVTPEPSAPGDVDFRDPITAREARAELQWAR